MWGRGERHHAKGRRKDESRIAGNLNKGGGKKLSLSELVVMRSGHYNGYTCLTMENLGE